MSWRPHYAPSDLDFRIWLAWHDATNRLYVAMERLDDVYENDYVRGDPLQGDMQWHDSGIGFWVDGDRSGGELMPQDTQGLPLSSWAVASLAIRSAQAYSAIAETHDGGPHVDSFFALRDWLLRPPYCDGSGRRFSHAPVVTVLEFCVTPFDDLILDDPESSVVSDLYPGKTIGFTVLVTDRENGEWTLHGFTEAISEYQLELLPHGIMVGKTQSGSGLHQLSQAAWGSIKHTTPADSTGVPVPGD